MMIGVPNLIYIRELSDGDETFVNEILQVIHDEFPKELVEYKSALNNQKFSEAAKLVHKLKHKFGVLNVKAGYQLAIEHEKALKNKSLIHVNEFEKYISSIEHFLMSNQSQEI